MIETALMFGPESALLGILTQPASLARPELVFLMFNAGLVSRVGPHRVNVKLARALAVADQASFRFDLSGRGDSRGAVSGSDFEEQSVRDICSAMDHIQRTWGTRRFALIGICSGARAALAAAYADRRIGAVLMFDGHTFSTRWTVPVRRWKRFRASSWPTLLNMTRRRLTTSLTREVQANEEPEPGESLSRVEFIRQVNALVERRLAVFFVFSGSWLEVYSYAAQFRHAFRGEGFVDKVRCDFRPDIDHTMVSLEAQRKLIDLVLQWVPTVSTACTQE